MKVYINDCSIERQASTEDEALDILWGLAKTVVESRSIAFEKKAFRTREMADREIIGGVSVKEALTRIVQRKFRSDEVQFTLQVLLRRPFADSVHLNAEDVVSNEAGACLKSTCFDSASESVSGALVISAAKSEMFGHDAIKLKSSIYGRKVVLNAWSEENIKQLSWVFDPNAKHRNEERVERGVVISAMDLSGDDAQQVLTNGVMIGRRVYGCFSGAWYQFHKHVEGLYHGFKIELAENNPDHMKALETFTRLEFKECGQIFDS